MAYSVPGWAASILGLVPTPCLYVDLDAVDRNIASMNSILGEAGPTLRPHFKAHKCTRLLRRQIASSRASGVTCGTAQEASILAREGFEEILVANEVVERRDAEQIASVARRVETTVVVDHALQVERLSSAAASYEVNLGVLIDVDPGLGRTGVAFDSPHLVGLAKAIGRSRSLAFRGIQAYEGNVVLQRDPDVRRSMSWQVAALLRAAIGELSAAGFECDVVSGGGTGTATDGAAAGVFTEIQAGSYVLMDTTYGEIGLDFEQALFGVATVISRRSSTTAALNAGTKALSVDKGMPLVLAEGARLVGMGDEHGRLALSPSASLQVGDRVLLVPSHVDPTVNLHDVLHVGVAGNIEVWPVDGRRSHMETS